ncbi:hypothetical protein, partial [Brevundimonas sp.]|uniref:hypothetical protein n=1 Tax=Brevundimonas sp. TaxID=1871086 RepID=UPI0028AAC0DD
KMSRVGIFRLRLVILTAPFQQQAALAQSIVVAEALDQRQTSAGDGFGSTVRFRVVDRLKGDLSAGAEFALRQQSTETMDVSTDLRPAAGEQFLLLLSRDYYQQLVAEAGRARMQPMRRSCRAIWFLQRA